MEHAASVIVSSSPSKSTPSRADSGRWNTEMTALRSTRLTLGFLVVASVGVVVMALPALAAVVGPLGWLGSIWQGDPRLPMNEQLPLFESVDSFGLAALALVLFSGALLLHGRSAGTFHKSSRAAMATSALALYLALLSTSLPYVVTRSAFSAIAIGFIFGARFVPALRPAKTALFFIGVAFTTEALAWSLADSTATLTGFGIFTVTAAFFSRVDKKRALKAACFCSAGLLVFLVALTRSADASIVVTVLAVLFGIGTSAWIISSGHKNTPKRQVREHVQAFDTSPDGLTDLAYPHIELLGRRGSRIVYHCPELKVAKNPSSGLTMFKVASVFGDTSSVLIGCGTPNLATSVYDDAVGTWTRMSAFMLYRERSHVSTLDELQAGVYFELRGLNAETRRRLIEAMESFSGARVPSCAYLNSRVLAAAGFSLGGGRDITRVVRPSRLTSLIWRFGLEHDGRPVIMRVVNTSPLEVGDHFVGVWRKEANSPIRLVRKMVARKREVAHFEPLAAQDVALRTSTPWVGRPVTVWMNRPNLFGLVLTAIWGRHAEFKVAVPGLGHSPDLMTPLESFPGKLSWLSKAKKHFLFSRPVVAMINKIKNKSFERYDDVPVDAALEMMSPVGATADQRVLWNFALILSDDSYQVRLSPLKNMDPLSQESKLRKVSNWILAKHVVATGYDENTVYAGEAWVERSVNGDRIDHTLCVNDNSGTYKPSAVQLESVGRLFGQLGLTVRTISHAH